MAEHGGQVRHEVEMRYFLSMGGTMLSIMLYLCHLNVK